MADAHDWGSTNGLIRGFNMVPEFTAARTTAALVAELFVSLLTQSLGIVSEGFNPGN